MGATPASSCHPPAASGTRRQGPKRRVGSEEQIKIVRVWSDLSSGAGRPMPWQQASPKSRMVKQYRVDGQGIREDPAERPPRPTAASTTRRAVC